MKKKLPQIIISHPDKQHTPRLLQTLQHKNLLGSFYTTLSSNKLPTIVQKLRVGKLLRKRYFNGIPANQTTHFPLIFLLNKVFKIDNYRFTYRWFDRKVAHKLRTDNSHIVIGYENANLESFKEAKRSNKITILDLAAVHHIQNEHLWENYEAYRRTLPSEAYFKMMNTYKEEALRYTDYCFCLSEYAKKTMIKGGFPNEKIYINALGVDTQVFAPKKSYQKGANSPFKLLFVGRMTALKGLLLLFKVMVSLQSTNIQLKLIGPKNPGENILDNLPDNCSYQSFLLPEQLVQEYQEADVFISPSYTDSWAQTVIEAMACGTPVIVSENTGSKDAVQQGGGFVIPVNDVAALKEKVLFFYHNREEVECMGRKAHEIAQQYTWESYETQVIDALEDISSKERIHLLQTTTK